LNYQLNPQQAPSAAQPPSAAATPTATTPTVPKTMTPKTQYGTEFEKWYMDQMGMSYAGEAWERPQGMSDLEYQKGKALENAHIAQGRADAKLNQQMGRIEAQRSSALMRNPMM
jgi:hypothetical protein